MCCQAVWLALRLRGSRNVFGGVGGEGCGEVGEFLRLGIPDAF